MAEIKYTPAVLKEPTPPPPVTPVQYHLTMSAEELAALWTVFQCIGGSPDTTIRGHCSTVTEAIEKLVPELHWSGKTVLKEYDEHPYGVKKMMEDRYNGIVFNNHSKTHPLFKSIVDVLKRKS